MADVVVSGIKLVWDLVTGLISGYENQKKNLFSAHVEPLREKMLSIHKDYIAGFQQIKRHLESSETPPSAVIDFLEQRRRDYLTERELAGDLAQALSSAERRIVRDEVWASVKAYCQAISDYFSASSEIAGISWYTDFIQMVKSRVRVGAADVWDASAIRGNPRGELLKEVKEILDARLPAAFSPINKHYAALRTQLL